jgi:hypothetical protein
MLAGASRVPDGGHVADHGEALVMLLFGVFFMTVGCFCFLELLDPLVL